MTRKVRKDRNDGGNMKDDKSSLAGEPMPRTQNTDLGYQPLLSGENLEFHQQHTHTQVHTQMHMPFLLRESGKSDGNVRGGKYSQV